MPTKPLRFAAEPTRRNPTGEFISLIEPRGDRAGDGEPSVLGGFGKYRGEAAAGDADAAGEMSLRGDMEGSENSPALDETAL